LFEKNPKIVTLHINWHKEIFFRKNWIRAKLYEIYENFMLKNYDKYKIKKIVFVDEDTYRHYTIRFPKLQSISAILPVGVDMQQFRKADRNLLRKKFGFKPNDKIIISVGRLVKEKSLELALKSYKLLDHENYHLIIVGTGPDESRLKKISKSLRLKNCYFYGYVENNILPAYLNCADLFLLTSLYEGTPTTILEALSCGLPVVTTDVGGVSSIIRNGYNGYVVKKRDPKILKKCILQINRNSMVKNCIQSVKPYSLKAITKHYISFYKELENED
jgi:glycosyltransferase involved in cell wall biosynthesis